MSQQSRMPGGRFVPDSGVSRMSSFVMQSSAQPSGEGTGPSAPSRSGAGMDLMSPDNIARMVDLYTNKEAQSPEEMLPVLTRICNEALDLNHAVMVCESATWRLKIVMDFLFGTQVTAEAEDDLMRDLEETSDRRDLMLMDDDEDDDDDVGQEEGEGARAIIASSQAILRQIPEHLKQPATITDDMRRQTMARLDTMTPPKIHSGVDQKKAEIMQLWTDITNLHHRGRAVARGALDMVGEGGDGDDERVLPQNGVELTKEEVVFMDNLTTVALRIVDMQFHHVALEFARRCVMDPSVPTDLLLNARKSDVTGALQWARDTGCDAELIMKAVQRAPAIGSELARLDLANIVALASGDDQQAINKIEADYARSSVRAVVEHVMALMRGWGLRFSKDLIYQPVYANGRRTGSWEYIMTMSDFVNLATHREVFPGVYSKVLQGVSKTLVANKVMETESFLLNPYTPDFRYLAFANTVLDKDTLTCEDVTTKCCAHGVDVDLDKEMLAKVRKIVFEGRWPSFEALELIRELHDKHPAWNHLLEEQEFIPKKEVREKYRVIKDLLIKAAAIPALKRYVEDAKSREKLVALNIEVHCQTMAKRSAKERQRQALMKIPVDRITRREKTLLDDLQSQFELYRKESYNSMVKTNPDLIVTVIETDAEGKEVDVEYWPDGSRAAFHASQLELLDLADQAWEKLCDKITQIGLPPLNIGRRTCSYCKELHQKSNYHVKRQIESQFWHLCDDDDNYVEGLEPWAHYEYACCEQYGEAILLHWTMGKVNYPALKYDQSARGSCYHGMAGTGKSIAMDVACHGIAHSGCLDVSNRTEKTFEWQALHPEHQQRRPIHVIRFPDIRSNLTISVGELQLVLEAGRLPINRKHDPHGAVSAKVTQNVMMAENMVPSVFQDGQGSLLRRFCWIVFRNAPRHPDETLKAQILKEWGYVFLHFIMIYRLLSAEAKQYSSASGKTKSFLGVVPAAFARIQAEMSHHVHPLLKFFNRNEIRFNFGKMEDPDRPGQYIRDEQGQPRQYCMRMEELESRFKRWFKDSATKGRVPEWHGDLYNMVFRQYKIHVEKCANPWGKQMFSPRGPVFDEWVFGISIKREHAHWTGAAGSASGAGGGGEFVAPPAAGSGGEGGGGGGADPAFDAGGMPDGDIEMPDVL